MHIRYVYGGGNTDDIGVYGRHTGAVPNKVFPVVSVRARKFARLFVVYNAKDGSLRLGSALDCSSEHTTNGCDVTVSLRRHAKIVSPSVPVPVDSFR